MLRAQRYTDVATPEEVQGNFPFSHLIFGFEITCANIGGLRLFFVSCVRFLVFGLIWDV